MDLAEHDLSALVAGVLPLLRSAVGPAVTIRSDLASGLAATLLDPVGLGAVVLDLVTDARDALQGDDGGPLIVIRTRLEHLGQGRPEQLAAGPYAVLEVAGTPVGPCKTGPASLFESRLSASLTGPGAAGGLAAAQRYAGQSGGTVCLAGSPGAGTTVRVYLPVAAGAQARADAAETSRLASLQRHAILDTGSEEDFDTLVREAASLCHAPIALISLVDTHRQWFKAQLGLAVRQTPRAVAFCDHAIVDPLGMLVVSDTHADARFSGNPLVRGEPHVRFYAGMALHDASGMALGTLCVIDHVPRELDAATLAELRALSLRAAGLLRGRVVAPADMPLHTPASGAGGHPAQRMPARVLVVDDEPDLRELAGTWLESLGYTVAMADSAAKALEQLQTGDFDILFTDVVMPGGMDGLELARQARQQRPGLRVVLTSGYSNRLQTIPELPGILLPKPYRKKDIEKAFAGFQPDPVAEAGQGMPILPGD
jgi:CheY-like chemotaxis protein